MDFYFKIVDHIIAFVTGVPGYVRGDKYFTNQGGGYFANQNRGRVYTDLDGVVWRKYVDSDGLETKRVKINDPNFVQDKLTREQMNASDRALYDAATYVLYGAAGMGILLVGALIGAVA